MSSGTYTQSEMIDDVRSEMRQTSSEATEAIAHLAEDTICSITSTVSRNVRAELHNFIREKTYRPTGCVCV